MYRVIQVAEGQLDGQTEGTGAISGYPATQSMTQVGAAAGLVDLGSRGWWWQLGDATLEV